MLYKDGNLLDLAENGEFDVIIHGCNAFHRMKSGLAKEISERYPEVVEADNKTTYGDRSKIGTYSQCLVNNTIYDGFLIINAYTQFHMNKIGEPFKDHFEYEGFQNILNELLKNYGSYRFGFPKIGCGLAGGDEAKIMKMLEDFSKKVDEAGGSVTLVVLP